MKKRLSQPNKGKKAANTGLARQYVRIFGTVLPRRNPDDFYFQEPSLLKWVPTETVYGINAPAMK